LVDIDSAAASPPADISTDISTDISAAIKEVLTAPVIPTKDMDDDRKKNRRLIIPINSVKKRSSGTGKIRPGVAVSDSKSSLESDVVLSKKKDTDGKSNIGLGKQWRRLRPGQKFRFRLGLASLAFVSLWNTVFIRNYSGFVTGILTGAAATTTATGFGAILRRWLSSRGFQGIAALGRSVAYGWAIFVAYPRMLDRRAKDRGLKREEESLKQWQLYLKGTADEVVRLRRELSLLEGEIRTFRREILAIRAARVESSSPTANRTGSTDSDENSIHNQYQEPDRILREAIVNEMSHLTRLRDDTRLALTAARRRWSEVRAKKPISHSKSAPTSAFDALEFELGAAIDFEYKNTDSGNEDPLLTGF